MIRNTKTKCNQRPIPNLWQSKKFHLTIQNLLPCLFPLRSGFLSIIRSSQDKSNSHYKIVEEKWSISQRTTSLPLEDKCNWEAFAETLDSLAAMST